MTLTIAVAGKSGSGKTTVTKNIAKVFHKLYPEKSILLFDNDLSTELGYTYGKEIRKTIYGIRSGKHEYRTGIPKNMTKQEYIEWALEDILVNVDENTDLIVSWLSPSKDCSCPVTGLMREALKKLVSRYDIVLFDCEFDLKYLHQSVDVPINSTLIITLPDEDSVKLSARIAEYSAKYAAGEQMGIIFNKTDKNDISKAFELAEKYDLETLGIIACDPGLSSNTEKVSDLIMNTAEEFIFRLNIPQGA